MESLAFIVEDGEDPPTDELVAQFIAVTGAQPMRLIGIGNSARIVDHKPVKAATPPDAVLACWPASAHRIADHPRAWRIGGEIALTVEPYLGNRESEVEGACAAFEAAGWRCVSLPRGYGLWAPPRSRLLLVAKPDSKVDLDELRSRLLRAKRPYWRESSHRDASLAEMVAAELVNGEISTE